MAEPLLPSKLLSDVKQRAGALDQSGDWPAQDLHDLAEAGAMRWVFELPPLDLHLQYESVARASLADALILSQRDSATSLIEAGQGDHRQLLDQLAKNQAFATIGIAQLTTSRQGASPVLIAKSVSDGFQIKGLIPWATGAKYADWIVAGAAVESGGQILFCLATKQEGVTIDPPAQLVALRSTWTAGVKCESVFVETSKVLHGPVEHAMTLRRKSHPMGPAFLALGLCQSALDLIGEHTGATAPHQEFSKQLAALRPRILDAQNADPLLRGQVNDLAIRITQAAVAIYKGSALMLTHPAQRLAREAMFLLVWSCPNPVIDCTVDRLTGA